MSVYTDVKARGRDMNIQSYIEMTKSEEHPNGVAPWAGNASESDVERWQSHLDETGELPTDGRLTQDEANLAKWIAVSEEMARYEGKEDSIPKSLRSRAEKVWADDFNFKEPKGSSGGRRKQTIQMFLALPEALRSQYGDYQQGILWETLHSPETVEALAERVVAAFPESTYKNDPIGRMKTDINKFNKALFNCQNDGEIAYKPESPYPLLGLPEKKSAAADDNDSGGAEVVA